MPQPIMPVHKLDAHEALFDVISTMSESNSALQAIVLDLPTKTAAIKYEPRILELLEKINRNEDELITAASNAKTKLDEKYYHVPDDIDSNEVLSLKAAGLLTGGSKSVKFTERGVIALRGKWLGESNQVKTTRTKNKFEYRQALLGESDDSMQDEGSDDLSVNLQNGLKNLGFEDGQTTTYDYSTSWQRETPDFLERAKRPGQEITTETVLATLDNKYTYIRIANNEEVDRAEFDSPGAVIEHIQSKVAKKKNKNVKTSSKKFMRISALKAVDGKVAHRCNCENTQCHPEADCKATEGLKLYEDHGIKVTLCPSCAKKW